MTTAELIEGHRPVRPPAGVPVWDVDPYDAAILSDPAAYYSELRRLGPFVYLPRYAMLACGRYGVTKNVFSDHTRFVSSRGVGLTDFSLETPWRPPSIILEVDPPDHTKARRVMARVMSPGVVARLRHEFQTEADALIARVLVRGRIDGVVDIAEAYSTSVFPRAVGLRNTDQRRLVDYGAMVFNALGPDNAIRRTAMAQASAIVPWITAQCERENLTPGGIGADIYAAADAGDLTTREAALLVRSLLSAGVDTTVTAIGSALWALATHPDQFARMKAEPHLARNAFEETLRLTSPVHSFCRTAAQATFAHGVDIEAGTKILCVLGAANLDPTQWEDADRFDIGRRAGGHLAFGVGIHGCIGQNVARAEGEAVLRAVAQQMSQIDLDGPAAWRPNNAIHALDRLPMIIS
jgi:4-methoxybenzoate monooxygenase (O-demethylating)